MSKLKHSNFCRMVLLSTFVYTARFKIAEIECTFSAKFVFYNNLHEILIFYSF